MNSSKKHNELFIADYQRYFCHEFKIQPDKIESKVEGMLNELIHTEVLSEKNMNVFVSERKGANLFHLFFDRISKKHNISYVKIYNSSPIFRVKNKKTTCHKKSILLTDAIGAGTEVSKTIIELKHLGMPISKVCGYVAQEETLKRIESEFPGIQFKFKRVVKNEKEYKKCMFCELVPYSHLKMEPLDLEHPFYIYAIMPKIEQAEIKELLFKNCKNLFKNIELEEKDIEGDSVVIYNVDIKELQTLISKVVKPNKEFFIPNRLLLSFKFHKSQSKLRIMSCCPLEVKFDEIENGEIECKKFLSRRYCKTYNYDIPYSTKCPLCIDHYISLKILNMFIAEMITNEKHRFLLEREHRYI
ncbi:MAG TPA: hypothetical protein GXX65_12285 [Methanosarcina sp.]|nr:hypothetical protein [Methanosarcina sp.]